MLAEFTDIADAALAERLWTVEEFRLMHEIGLIGDDDRVELIEGHVVTMNAIGPEHAYVVARVSRLLSGAVLTQLERWHLTVADIFRLTVRTDLAAR
jgi:hypothetical protein